MKIVVINGTQVKGCTYHIKELFLAELRRDNQVHEFYLPADMPHFCCGCKACFFQSEDDCPHAGQVRPIWEAMLSAQLLVFSSPVYAMRTTGQMKALLDHLCVHWMVHRPDDRMFTKQAVVLTNAIGPFTGGAQRDIATSLSWLGVSDIRRLGIGLMEGVVWDQLSQTRRDAIARQVAGFARRYQRPARPRKGVAVTAKFGLCRMMHQATAAQEDPLSADNQYWLDRGWIAPKKRT